MVEKTTYKIGSVYFAIFGAIVFAIGVAEIALSIAGKTLRWGVLEIGGGFLLWRGVILFFAGIFYMTCIKNFADIHQLAKAVVASAMIWLVAGMELFRRILKSIPSGEEGGWLNTPEGFLNAYSAPYIPELFLLPFSFVVIYYIKTRKIGQ